MEELYRSLSRRLRPEDVAQMILDKYESELSWRDRRAVQKAAKHSLKQGRYNYSSMRFDYLRPVGAQNQLAKGHELFPGIEVDSDAWASDPDLLDDYAAKAGGVICKSLGKNHFSEDRLSKKQRKEAGLDISKRQYNKRFRFLKRLERKSQRLEREHRKYEITLIANTGLTFTLPYDEFAKDSNTACFIAYFVARCNLRSVFTIDGQQIAYDNVADRLLSRCRQSETTHWWAIAHVFPEQEVLAKLSDQQKGELLGTWFGILEKIATMLEEVWAYSDINRNTMIVKRGNDSSTWNRAAAAWNKARDAWIALNYSMGTEEVIDNMCFGKVMRLMAADVAFWHQTAGGSLESDTHVWADIPFPWQVFKGEAYCTKDYVQEVCLKHKVDPVKKGWIAPRPKKKPVKFKPTPELVHGIAVAHPGLAAILKKEGYFSGKPKHNS